MLQHRLQDKVQERREWEANTQPPSRHEAFGVQDYEGVQQPIARQQVVCGVRHAQCPDQGESVQGGVALPRVKGPQSGLQHSRFVRRHEAGARGGRFSVSVV